MRCENTAKNAPTFRRSCCVPKAHICDPPERKLLRFRWPSSETQIAVPTRCPVRGISRACARPLRNHTRRTLTCAQMTGRETDPFGADFASLTQQTPGLEYIPAGASPQHGDTVSFGKHYICRTTCSSRNPALHPTFPLRIQRLPYAPDLIANCRSNNVTYSWVTQGHPNCTYL